MDTDSQGIMRLKELFGECLQILIQNGIIDNESCHIDEQKLSMSIYATMPDFRQSTIDKLVDLATTNADDFPLEMESAINTYRFFRIVGDPGKRFARIVVEVLYLRALQMYPLDYVLTTSAYSMGRCTGLDAHGKRCRRRAVAARLCAGHAPQNQPAPPPAAE